LGIVVKVFIFGAIAGVACLSVLVEMTKSLSFHGDSCLFDDLMKSRKKEKKFKKKKRVEERRKKKKKINKGKTTINKIAIL
jgi:hypothetical protein